MSKEEAVGIAELKAQLSHYLREVRAGRPVTVLDRGRAVARLVPVAIHLATALLWRERDGRDLTMATHDRALATAARAFGLEVAGA